MPTDALSITILVVAGLILLVAIFTLLLTPASRRFSVWQRTVEEELPLFPASAQARVISGNRRKATLGSLPWIVAALPLMLYVVAMQFVADDQCKNFFGMSAGLVGLVLLCYWMPGLSLIYTLSMVSVGRKTLREGYFPPLDSVEFRDVIATRGTASTLRGYVLILLPILGFLLMVLGHHSYSSIAQGRSIQEMHQAFTEDCGT